MELTFNCDHLKVPLNYQHMIQGLIYSAFDQKNMGEFLHDEGYRFEKKVFKLFVFSNLFGKYKIEAHSIIFENEITFYVSSYSEEFMKTIYAFFNQNGKAILNHQIISLKSMKFIKTEYFKEKDVVLHTLSPVVNYRTENNFVTYFKPSDPEFESLCINNLKDKCKVLELNEDDVIFECLNVSYEKKRLVKFKNTFYVAYMTELTVKTNYETLSLIMDTGLSAKGPAGFGMIEVKN